MTIIPYLLLAIVACNIAVVLLLTRAGNIRQRERDQAVQQSQNVVRFYPRRGQLLDIRS